MSRSPKVNKYPVALLNLHEGFDVPLQGNVTAQHLTGYTQGYSGRFTIRTSPCRTFVTVWRTEGEATQQGPNLTPYKIHSQPIPPYNNQKSKPLLVDALSLQIAETIEIDNPNLADIEAGRKSVMASVTRQGRSTNSRFSVSLSTPTTVKITRTS